MHICSVFCPQLTVSTASQWVNFIPTIRKAHQFITGPVNVIAVTFAYSALNQKPNRNSLLHSYPALTPLSYKSSLLEKISTADRPAHSSDYLTSARPQQLFYPQ